jgi:hypothetical protein
VNGESTALMQRVQIKQKVMENSINKLIERIAKLELVNEKFNKKDLA